MCNSGVADSVKSGVMMTRSHGVLCGI